MEELTLELLKPYLIKRIQERDDFMQSYYADEINFTNTTSYVYSHDVIRVIIENFYVFNINTLELYDEITLLKEAIPYAYRPCININIKCEKSEEKYYLTDNIIAFACDICVIDTLKKFVKLVKK